MWEDRGYKGGVLERRDRGRWDCEEGLQPGWGTLGRVEGGRDQERLPTQVPDRGAIQGDQRPPLPRRMRARTQLGQHGPSREDQEVERRDRRGVDDKPPSSREDPRGRGRAEGSTTGSWRRAQRGIQPELQESQEERKEEKEERKRKGEGEGKVEGKGEKEKAECDPGEEGFWPRLRSHPGSKRVRSRSQEEVEDVEESKEFGQEEEGEKEREQLLLREFGKGQLGEFDQFPRFGCRGGVWPDPDCEAHMDEVSGSANSLLSGQRARAVAEHPRPTLGNRQEGTPSPFPSVLPGQPCSTNDPGDAPRSLAPCLRLGLGPPGEGAGAVRRAQSTPQGSGGSGLRKALDRYGSTRVGPGGAGISCDLHGVGAGGERSERSGQAQGPDGEALCIGVEPRERRRQPERRRKEQRPEKSRKRERLEEGSTTRRERSAKRGQLQQGEAQRQVSEKVLEEYEVQSEVKMSMGEEESPLVSGSGRLAPGRGAADRKDGSEEAVTTPRFTDPLIGSEGEKIGPSQEYLPDPETEEPSLFLVEERGALEGKKLVAMGDLLMKIMNDLCFEEFSHSKLQPMGKGSDLIFPLPWSSDIVKRSSHPEMVSATCRALNSLYGVSADGEKREPGPTCERALKFVIRCVDSLGLWDGTFPRIDFDIFFRSKGVDYRGEEVKVAQRVSWASLSPAIPPEVGGVNLVDFCSLGTKYYVENFSEFLVPPEKRWLGRAPTVMIQDCDWKEVCEGLINCGICDVIPLQDVCHIRGRPLLGGLFGVGKGEYVGPLETQRLIMNFIPLNNNCRPLDSDIATLPGISGLSPFLLEDGEVALISSEDIRFFYLFRVPSHWFPFLGFNKVIPESLVPEKWRGLPCVLHACVLPMGFRNSVGIAQHVHRNVIRQAMMNSNPPISGEGEMRKDKPATNSSTSFRIYLDNFDVVTKADPQLRDQLEGKPGLLSLVARQAYVDTCLPRHPKKSVCQAVRAEVQGAIVDGEAGIAYPKPPKIGLYVALGLELLHRGAATQREMQIVCGGFVYFCMFRRPLLSALNAVWEFIESFKGQPLVVRLCLPPAVRLELVRFMALVPLARMDFRLCCLGPVTASDASSTGGGACVSTRLTDFGVAASNATVRGDIPEAHDVLQVLSIGLFDGVGCLRLACDLLGLPMAGHISVEKEAAGRRVVESAFAETIFVDDVAKIDQEMIGEWAGRFSQVGLILLGAGPPCQGVSGLNADKRGALRDERSCLFQHVPRIRDALKLGFPWAQVRTLMESVASMDSNDRAIMSQAIGVTPIKIDASGLTLAHRPRLYWCDWELLTMEGAELHFDSSNSWESFHEGKLTASLQADWYLEPGWALQMAEQRLPTFTTSRPSPVPGRRPAGLAQCSPGERLRWSQDDHRFPPYQYKDQNCLVHKRTGALRIASLQEREVIMGMPVGYTSQCYPKANRKEPEYTDCRLSLVGNAWSVPVVSWLIGCLGAVLGLCPTTPPQKIASACVPGGSCDLQRLLQRPPVHRISSVAPGEGVQLVKKLAGLVSMKGEDLLLHATSEPQVKYQRLRASLPSKLWRWKTIAGWTWSGSPEHINVLELRAIFTTVRWWASKRKAHSARFVHLTDSLVCLHALSRGRSSSRKMRRTMARLNSYLLVCNLHPVWAYVHTSDNPADRPSRRKVKKKWVK